MSNKGLTIRFDGADKLIQQFNRQPTAVKQEASNIIRNTALRVEKTAADNAPVDTGYLKQHIQSSSTGQLSAQVTSSANYSIYLEKGTRRMAPQPFMQPALETEKIFLYQKLNNLLQKGLL